MKQQNIQSFKLLSADLSLRRPAFANLQVDPENRQISLLSVVDLDNRKIKEGHGCILERIYSVLHELAGQADVFVRERGFTRFNTGSQALFKVVGIADLAVWQAKRGIFDEIPPTTVKKLLTGNGMASKDEVAEALARYVGPFQYASDDQSDAVAVGVAWLLLHFQKGCA